MPPATIHHKRHLSELPLRVSVYDPDDTVKRWVLPTVSQGRLEEYDVGEEGLVGYADFVIEEDGNIRLGYVGVASSHQGKGIGRYLFDYLLEKTPKDKVFIVGNVIHKATEHMAIKASKEYPGRVKWGYVPGKSGPLD